MVPLTLFTVHRNDFKKAMEVLEQISNDLVVGSKGNDEIVKLSLVGVGIRSHAGIAAKMFKALSDEGINICMISTSEIKISLSLMKNIWSLVGSLHKEFDLEEG